MNEKEMLKNDEIEIDLGRLFRAVMDCGHILLDYSQV